MPQKKIGRYEIKSELGRGGFATVYLAYDPRFERDVAIKFLPPELLHADPQFRVRFEREAKIIAQLEHAAIVPVYDVGEENNQPYFVMRYMRGGSLAEKIKSRVYPIEDVVRIFEHLAPGIDEAHARGIVHRDLKPGNILFDNKGIPTISDFGIAKLLASQTENTTRGAIGTPAYMSPEQAAGDSGIDRRTDIYALGIILYEMLTGNLPYKLEDTPVFPKTNSPTWVNKIISTAMSKDKEERFSSAAEMVEALKAAIQGHAPSLGRRKKSKSKNFFFVGAFVFLLISVAIGLFMFQDQLFSTPPSKLQLGDSIAEFPLSPTTFVVTESISATNTSTSSLPVIGGADKVAFLNNNNIWIMNVDGSELQSVTNDKDKKFNLEWLPDGKTLLYITGKTVKTVDIETLQIETITSFSASEFFESFHVSPDGKQVAISLARELHVVPFNLNNFRSITQKDDLLALEGCIFFNGAEVKNAIWSDDGTKLTIKFSTLIRKHLADTMRVMDISLCRDSTPLRLDEFPAQRFEFPETIVSISWDGDELFLLNSIVRNDGFGKLGMYNYTIFAFDELAPIDNACCYRDAVFSPDGTYVFFAFQDLRLGSEGPILLYYLPFDSLIKNGVFQPLPLPDGFFNKRDDAPLPVLRPSQN